MLVEFTLRSVHRNHLNNLCLRGERWRHIPLVAAQAGGLAGARALTEGALAAAEAEGELHDELNRMSKQGKWDDMAGLIDDEILHTLSVVGARHEIANKLLTRFDGIADGVSLTHNRYPDPHQWADVVAELKRRR